MKASKQALKWQLFVRVAALMGVLIPLLGIVRYSMYQSEVTAEFENRVQAAAAVLEVALREPLWDLDETQIEESVRALSNNQALLAVRIVENGPSQYERMFVRDGNSQLSMLSSATAAQIDADLKHPFKVSWKDTELALGELYFSKHLLVQDLRNNLIVLVAQLLSFGIAVLLLLYYLVSRYVGQPLTQLHAAMNETDATALHQVVEHLPANELRLLAERYASVLNDLREHQQHLTEMVLTRTRALSEANEQLENEIDRRARIEKELISARELAEQASEAKTYFLAHMSHELRTPLNGIIGYTQLLQHETVEPARQREYVEHVEVCANHLLELINRVLDLSKIEQGSLELAEQPFDLPRLLNEVIAVVRPRAETKGLKLINDWSPLPQTVLGDVAKLRQILINLLGNAVKFTDAGSVTLMVRLVGEEVISFAVVDTGSGIAERDQARVFEAFQQAGNVAQQVREGGTGLGLSIAKRFVELLGGDLQLQSTLGMGSRFSFQLHLPVSEVAAKASAPLQIGRLLGDVHPHILIVDDVAHNREILAQMLNRIGFETEMVSSGEQAIAAVKARTPDLVFLDIRMPDMDGISCARILRQEHPQLPLLAFTASLFDPALDKDIQQWFNGLALKPINIVDICAQIAKILPVHYGPPLSANAPVQDTRELAKAQMQALGDADVEQLRHWLASGSIAKIRDFAADLRTHRQSCTELADSLHALARAYDIESLRRLIAP